jgi:hypothetical protein
MAESKFDLPSWFDLNRYMATGRLDFDGWRIQIGNRIYLDRLLAADMTDQFDLHFAEIKESPFMDIGFEDNYASRKAAYPLTFGMANAMVNTLAPLAPHREADCDQALSEAGQVSFAMHAHLTIDFNASETEIINDFKAWLTSAAAKNRTQFPRNRDAGITKAVIKSWHDHQILPYEDLRLWHLRQHIEMPSQTILAHWLFSTTYAGKDKARDMIAKALSAYQLTTLRQLFLAAN